MYLFLDTHSKEKKYIKHNINKEFKESNKEKIYNLTVLGYENGFLLVCNEKSKGVKKIEVRPLTFLDRLLYENYLKYFNTDSFVANELIITIPKEDSLCYVLNPLYTFFYKLKGNPVEIALMLNQR